MSSVQFSGITPRASEVVAGFVGGVGLPKPSPTWAEFMTSWDEWRLHPMNGETFLKTEIQHGICNPYRR